MKQNNLTTIPYAPPQTEVLHIRVEQNFLASNKSVGASSRGYQSLYTDDVTDDWELD